jgi:2-polyprenyl-6-methoxyphenol hydroxylase-like FAD-dependent oxidoreductase
MVSPREDSRRVLVVGASMAGLLSARALADHVEEIVVLEREELVDRAQPRGRVPQGRHLHLLLSAGLDRLVGWFPGLTDELEGLGAVRLDGYHAWVHQGGAYRRQGNWGRWVLSMTRPLLEQVVRRRVAQLPQVTIRSGVAVEGVALSDGAVTGVLVDGQVVDADLVVDASGRSSRIAHDLAERHLLVPPMSRVAIDIGYASCFLRRSPGDLDGSFVVVQDQRTLRAGAVLPVEGDRWQVTIAGVHGDVPPADDPGLVEFARRLPSPTVADLLEHCERVSPVATYRFPSSQRRHYERLRRLPVGLVTVGDASSSFDPIYGQGMTSSALQAAALGYAVNKSSLRDPNLPVRFHRKAARVIDAPWRIAVGGDFSHPATVGPRPLGTAQLNGYVQRVIRATHSSVEVAHAFNRVVQLADPPAALVRPSTVARVLVSARHSPVVTGEAIRHPRVGEPRPT